MSSIILEAEAKNYTPLMAGDATGSVAISLSNGATVTAAQLGRQIKGRSRWLLKTLIHHLDLAPTLGRADYRPLVSVKARGKQLNLGLPQVLYGTTRPQAWKALYNIQTILTERRVKQDRRYMRGTATRVGLATMGQGQDKNRKMPIPPRGLKLTLRITRRLPNNAIEINGGRVGVELLDALAAGLALTVLRILGIGQGANRGFGRFTFTIRLEGRPGNREVSKLINIMQDLDRPQHNVDERILQVFKYLSSIISRIGGGASASIEDSIDVKSYQIKDKTVQCIEQRILRELPGRMPWNLRVLDNIRRDLEMIGIVVMKAAWKKVNDEQRSGGAAYHTWVLGLPRMQKIKKPSMKCNKLRGNPPTGYLVRTGALDEGGTTLYRIDNDHNLYTDRVPRGWRGAKEKFSDGRRQSPIILFPLDPRGQVITLIGFKPRDMKKLVNTLYHAGGLILSGARNPEFLGVVRLADVTTIAYNGISKAEKECNGNVFVNDEAAGVAIPGAKTHGEDSHELGDPPPDQGRDEHLVNSAYSAALKFINYILRGCV